MIIMCRSSLAELIFVRRYNLSHNFLDNLLSISALDCIKEFHGPALNSVILSNIVKFIHKDISIKYCVFSFKICRINHANKITKLILLRILRSIRGEHSDSLEPSSA